MTICTARGRIRWKNIQEGNKKWRENKKTGGSGRFRRDIPWTSGARRSTAGKAALLCRR
jgi:hypothetical protein